MRRVDGVYRVEEVERVRVQRRVLRTSEESALHRYLALSLAARWRSARRLGLLMPVDRPLPDGMRVELSGTRNASLRWVEDGVERRADDLVPHRADDLARTLLHPLEVVVAALLAHDLESLVASYRDPAGRPALVLVEDASARTSHSPPDEDERRRAGAGKGRRLRDHLRPGRAWGPARRS